MFSEILTDHVALFVLRRKTGKRDQAKASSAIPHTILSQPALEPLLLGRVLPRKEATPFRLSSRYMLPSNTTGVLHRMTSSDIYVLSSAGHRIM